MEALYFVLIIICLAFSAFFASAETSFISIQKARLQHMLDNRVKGAGMVARMLERPERLLSTVVLGNTLVNTAASAMATALAIMVFGEKTGALLAAVVMTAVLLVLGDTVPKTIASHYAERLALSSVKVLRWVAWLFAPVVRLLSWLAFGFTRMVGETQGARLLVSEEEIRTMIAVGEKQGVVEEDAARMLHRVFELGDQPVREIMVPRLKVVALEKGSKVTDFLEVYARSPVSRFPVYRDTMDRVVGLISIQDVMIALAKEQVTYDSVIDGLIRPAFFVPQTKVVSELLVEMRENNQHMVVVKDEYGGTAGIASLTSLVGQIVGPVGDELGTIEKEYEVLDEHTFQVDGGMRVDNANQALGLGLPEGEDYETVAGLVMKVLGRIAKPGENIRYRGLRITVSRMTGTKIEEVLITREKPAEGEKNRALG
jgi:putative hemolysin